MSIGKGTILQEYSPIIRDVAGADIPSITMIYATAVLNGTGSFEVEPPSEIEMTRRIETITGQGYPFLVIEIGGAVQGYAYASAYRPRPAYKHTVESSIYLREGSQGKGLGKLLLNELIARCEAGPYRQMIAVIGDANNSASIKLHAALGFEKVGHLREVGHKHNQWLDVVLMQRRLRADG